MPTVSLNPTSLEQALEAEHVCHTDVKAEFESAAARLKQSTLELKRVLFSSRVP